MEAATGNGEEAATKKKTKIKDAFEDALGKDVATTAVGLIHPDDIMTDYDESHPLYNQKRTEEPLDQGFVLNLFARGVLKNVLVRIIGKKIEVVDGARTVMHARAATKMRAEKGLEPILVPVTLRRGEAEELALDQVSANQFSKPEFEVLQKARRAAHLLNMGVPEEKVVIAFGGVSVPTLRSWMKLLTLPSKILDAVDKNRITAAIALEWVDSEPAEQLKAFQSTMEKLAAGGSVSASSLRRERVVKTKGEKSLRPSSGHLRKLVKIIEGGDAPALAKNAGFYSAINWVLGGGGEVMAGIPGLEDAWKVVLAPKKKEPKPKTPKAPKAQKAKKAKKGTKKGSRASSRASAPRAAKRSRAARRRRAARRK